MKPILLPTVIIALLPSLPAMAGSLTNASWTPSEACGVKPALPTIDDSSIEAYNKSVAAINEWQKKANAYYECLVKEANADNAVIAETANREQEAYRQAVQIIGEKAAAAKNKLDQQ